MSRAAVIMAGLTGFVVLSPMFFADEFRAIEKERREERELQQALEEEAAYEQHLQQRAMVASFKASSDFNPIDSYGHRLIGVGCGTEKAIYTAREEDHFPRCEEIDTVEHFCPDDLTLPPEPIEAWECAQYLERKGVNQ